MSLNNKNDAPIGVFDSGIGGLTVVREIMRQLPNENIVYFGDTARVPYGSKSKDTIIRYARQIIRFLKTKQVKAIVVACNTASALALDVIREEVDIPIIGVVTPGARAAIEVTKTNKIGVIATEATIRSEIYTHIIQGVNPEITVVGKACPLFVPLVEEGFAKHKVTGEMIEYYLASIKETDIDSLILGCTHYPLLRSRIRAYMGDSINLVNPAYETAMDLKNLLEENEIIHSGLGEEHGSYSFYVSDTADKFKEFANSILPYDIETTKQINIEEY
ncbi:MAG: glutamate racemase [Lachnospiraceae bacterium]|nr:glutamate racemase [Lachnospiraceae bacterium]